MDGAYRFANNGTVSKSGQRKSGILDSMRVASGRKPLAAPLRDDRHSNRESAFAGVARPRPARPSVRTLCRESDRLDHSRDDHDDIRSDPQTAPGTLGSMVLAIGGGNRARRGRPASFPAQRRVSHASARHQCAAAARVGHPESDRPRAEHDAPARFLQATIARSLDARTDRPALCRSRLVARRLCQGAKPRRDVN